MEEYGIEDLDYEVGTMIELPAAALGAAEIAQYAEFFSFGTNDLTQTTYGAVAGRLELLLPELTPSSTS